MTPRSGWPRLMLAVSILICFMALTMTAQELVQPNLDGFEYPVLARSARIQGAVQFVVTSDGIRLLSGHPMLAPIAKNNLEKWAVPYTFSTELRVTYNFGLTGTQMVEVNEPIGDRFDRFFRRLFHLPVTRKVKTCVDSEDSSVGFKNETKDGLSSIEIDVETGSRCLQTEIAQVDY